ncbi:Tyrosine recombinase XerC [compost metagenome]
MSKRKFLTPEEIFLLLKTITMARNTCRDKCMIYMGFIHGLRVSELTGLRLSDYDPLSNKINIRRLKGGFSTTHPLLPAEVTLLNNWLKERGGYLGSDSPWIFLSRKGGRISRQHFYIMVRNYGRLAKLPVHLHPHMLRHACGFSLAERGNDTRLIQDYLGHRNIRHTVHYTASNAARFARAWQKDETEQRDMVSEIVHYT